MLVPITQDRLGLGKSSPQSEKMGSGRGDNNDRRRSQRLGEEATGAGHGEAGDHAG